MAYTLFFLVTILPRLTDNFYSKHEEPMFVLVSDRHAKVRTICRDKFRSGRNLVLLLLGAYVVSTYGGFGLSVSDIISGGLLGHLGPLCLALGANR